MKEWSLVLLVLLAGQCAAQQPAAFRPGAVWPDNNGVPVNAHGGGILFHNNTYYWFGEHKIAGTAGNKAYVGVHCYSSADLYHWKDEGIALAVDSTPGSLIPPGAIIERPKVIYNKKNKQFVLWFHLELKGQKYKAALSGVAVSNNITGPYRFHHAERPNKGQLPVNYTPDFKGGDSLLLRDQAGGQMARDMNLFVDDDEKAYLVYTAEENRTVHISLLSDDYLTTAPQYARIFPDRFMEASAIFKSRGKYYFVASGCTGWAPNAARSAVADHLFGPWKELGNPCQGPRSSITFGGQSTYVLPVAGKKDAFIFMADEWRPDNAIDGRYLWLPVAFTGEGFTIPWRDQWSLSFFDSAQQVNTPSGGMHPGSQIAYVKKQVAAKRQPFYDAFQQLLLKADTALTVEHHALTDFSIPGYYKKPLEHRKNSLAIQVDGFAAYACALAWQLTGRKKYADKALYFLNAWAAVNKTYSDADGPLVMSYSGSSLVMAAALMRSCTYWPQASRQQLAAWADTVYRKACNSIRHRKNNWADWGRFGSMLADSYLGDQADLAENIHLLKSDLFDKIAPDGHMTEEVKREANGLWYSYFSLAPITASCWLAYTATGENLFTMESEGRSLKKALDYVLYYQQHPAEWPWFNNPVTGTDKGATGFWPANLLAAMSGIYKEEKYTAFVQPYGPLIYEKHHFAWTFPTLMPLIMDNK